MRQVTLSISSACEHCDGFPCSRQVLKEYLLVVWLRHFLSWIIFIPVRVVKNLLLVLYRLYRNVMKDSSPHCLSADSMAAMLPVSLFRV